MLFLVMFIRKRGIILHTTKGEKQYSGRNIIIKDWPGHYAM